MDNEECTESNIKLCNITQELKHHAPFTLVGAATGILFMILFFDIPHETAHSVFYVLHPSHVLLSAIVTSSMYKIHKKKNFQLWKFIVIGYVGSVGIGTLSDSVIPYIGELLLDLPRAEAHIGFIDQWWLINPLAFLGIAIAYYKPETKFPHLGHVLISTWASLFHMLMALGGEVNMIIALLFFVFLFVAVWLPCCISDIVFPLMFVEGLHHPECVCGHGTDYKKGK